MLFEPPSAEAVGSVLPELRHARLPSSFYTRIGKRIFDFLVAAFGLVILCPVLLLIAILVKVSSRGPILFRQKRIGRFCRPFSILKFRSMRDGAERQGPGITSADDSRVTSVGRILRRLKLDEVPQLWNVVVGDMSLVGPRPELPAFVETYTEDQRRVFGVRPGITDPASLAYRNEEGILAAADDPERYYREQLLPDKLALALQYVENISFGYDLRLILQTIQRVLQLRPNLSTR